MNGQERSRRGYDRLARHYRWLEHVLFRRQLQTARVALLDDVPPIRTALVLGDGDGRLLQQLCLAQPECRVTSVDQSSRMLQLQRRRMARIDSQYDVRFVHKDVRQFRPIRGDYDLLVTAFFLDCFTDRELMEWFPCWLEAVRPGGLYYFADFCQPSSGWRRMRADCYLGLMHWWFRWQTGLPNRRLVDLDGVLDKQPLSEVAVRSSSHGLLSTRLYRVEAAPGGSSGN